MNRSLVIVSVLVVASFARLNPFEPVKQPNMPIPVTTPPISEDDGNRTVKIMYDQTGAYEDVEKIELVTNNKTSPLNSMDNEKSMDGMKGVKEVSMPESNSTMMDKNTSKVEKMAVKEIKPKEKPKPKLLEKCYKPLPFLTIDLKKNKIDIESREKYKVKKLYTIPTQKKIVIDFYGSVKHYTKMGTFTSEEFSSYKIGNHPKEKFFRVVLTTKHNTEKYIPVIEKNMLTITYKK